MLGKLLGVNKKTPPSELEIRRQQRQDNELKAWRYIRLRVDLGIQSYLMTGDTDILEKFLAPDVLENLVRELNELKAQKVQWLFPSRYTESPTGGKVEAEIIDEQLANGERPVAFTVRERFKDFSQIKTSDGKQLLEQGKGEVRTMLIQVAVPQDKVYIIQSLRQLSHA